MREETSYLFKAVQQFALLIHQIQVPEDVVPAPSPTPAPNTSPTLARAAGEASTLTAAPPLPQTLSLPPRAPSLLMALINHIRTDPHSRLCTSFISSNTPLMPIISRAYDVHIFLFHCPCDHIAIYDPLIHRIDVLILLDAANCEICE